MVQDSWVGDLLPVFLFVFLFFVLLFIPCEHISCLGCGWVFRPMCLNPFPFLPLALMRADPALVGIGSHIINK